MATIRAPFQFGLLFLLVFAFIVQFALASGQPDRPGTHIASLPLPPPNPQAATRPTETPSTPDDWKKITYQIPKHGSFSHAMQHAGLSATVSWRVANTPNAQWLTQLKQGDTLDIWVNAQQQLQKIVFSPSKAVTYQLSRLKAPANNEASSPFEIKKIEAPVEVRLAQASGPIEGSFYLSAQAQGLSAKTIMQLADIYAWEIDFIRQLRPGDRFKLIYEKRYIEGEYVGDGDILAAQITTSGTQTHSAVLLRHPDTQAYLGYYDETGANLRKAFLRNPVDYVRITSRYQPKRFHPILKKWRAHRGVDYGGPTGTPIRATGDGQVIKRTRTRGYGRVIYIKHANRFTTVYAHMSRYGQYRVGDWVKQGEVIGYIGQTGLATGPHLHYEFRKNGRHVDPLKVKLPDANPVPEAHKARFMQRASLMITQLDRLSTNTQLAQVFD